MTWAAVAVGAGTAIGGVASGKKSDSSNGAANLQAQLAQQLFTETDPLRRSLIGRSAGFLGVPTSNSVTVGSSPTIPGPAVSMHSRLGGGIGGTVNSLTMPGSPDSTASPGITSGGGMMTALNDPSFLALRDATNSQFARARDNVLSTVPTGGTLDAALTGLEGARASSLSQGAGATFENELGRAMALATGTTGTALGGLGSAASAQALTAQANAAQQAGKSQALGSGLGAYVGHKA